MKSTRRLRDLLNISNADISEGKIVEPAADYDQDNTLKAGDHVLPRPKTPIGVHPNRPAQEGRKFGVVDVEFPERDDIGSIKDAENSIIVSKYPNHHEPYPSPKNSYDRGKKVTITTGEITKQRTRSVIEDSVDLDEILDKSRPDFEKTVNNMRSPSLIMLCSEMADYIRKLEKKSDLKEQLLSKTQQSLEAKSKLALDKDMEIRRLEKQVLKMEELVDDDRSERSFDSEHYFKGYRGERIKCKYNGSGCPYQLPSMAVHEDNLCKYRPARCPSLTCPNRPAFATILEHIKEDHDGTKKGRDRVCRNDSSHLVSSYVNIDKEPIFYKTSKMTWVANELVLDDKHFYLECMRIPPDWHIWVYFLGTEQDAQNYQVTITLFREDEYGNVGQDGFSAQRSYTGPVISIQRSKEEIAEYGLGFMVHDKQVRPLCGPIVNNEEQLFGYEVTLHKKRH